MPKVKLPVFDTGASTKQVMRGITRHRAGGAVIKVGPRYHLATLDDVSKSLDRHPSLPIAGLELVAPIPGTNVSAKWAHFEIARTLPAPLYVCPKRDQSSRLPRKCTFHGIEMVAVAVDN